MVWRNNKGAAQRAAPETLAQRRAHRRRQNERDAQPRAHRAARRAAPAGRGRHARDVCGRARDATAHTL
eukprot:4102195-Prymnesium_polylepis.2